jgi:hypothetical protein
VAQLGSEPCNSWIDEEGAASFFELSFQSASIEGSPATASSPGTGLGGVEVIASKIYLFGGTGLVLHVVWFRGSLYCVLADNTEDLPLLDVAFPDVTARNRVVQVRDYKKTTAEKLRDAFPGAPLPKCLRVWEGRRKGTFVEAPPPQQQPAAAKEGGAAKATAPAIATAGAGPGTAAAAAAAEGGGGVPSASLELEGDLYDMGGVAPSKPALSKPTSTPQAATASAIEAAAASAVGASAAAAKPAASGSSQIVQGVTKAPHFLAPMSGLGGGGGKGGGAAGEFSAMGMASRIIVVGGKEDEDAPWDASGRPKGT